MSDELRERVDELLTDADATSGAMLSERSDGDDSGDRSLAETAREASDLVESADPQDLLAAVGLDTLPDGSEPDSIPEAIARGDQESLEDLQRLLHLSNLADRSDDGELDDAIGGLRDSIGAGGGESETESDDEDGEPESTDEESSVASDVGDRVRSTLSDRFENVGDDVSSLRDRLEDAAANASESASEAKSAVSGDEDDGDEPEEEEDGGEGLFGADRGGDFGSGGSTRHSTMAPPPSKRADMRAVRRHSTMPKKH